MREFVSMSEAFEWTLRPKIEAAMAAAGARSVEFIQDILSVPYVSPKGSVPPEPPRHDTGALSEGIHTIQQSDEFGIVQSVISSREMRENPERHLGPGTPDTPADLEFSGREFMRPGFQNAADHLLEDVIAPIMRDLS